VGLELEVLQGLRRSTPFLSFEIGPPEPRRELLQCVDLLGGLSSSGQFNYIWDRRNGLALDNWLNLQAFFPITRRLWRRAHWSLLAKVISSWTLIPTWVGAFGRVGSWAIPRVIFAMRLRTVSRRYDGQDAMKALRIKGQRE
jgi:hypothetical protein